MEYDIRPGRYRHFKGKEYQVLGLARHSETEEWMVVYRPLYGEGGLWVRPASMWAETVERDGKVQPVFCCWKRKRLPCKRCREGFCFSLSIWSTVSSENGWKQPKLFSGYQITCSVPFQTACALLRVMSKSALRFSGISDDYRFGVPASWN